MIPNCLSFGNSNSTVLLLLLYFWSRIFRYSDRLSIGPFSDQTMRRSTPRSTPHSIVVKVGSGPKRSYRPARVCYLHVSRSRSMQIVNGLSAAVRSW